MEKAAFTMNFTNLTRTGTALVAGAALFAAFSASANATPTFNVSTTISASCSVTDSGPADLFPTYDETSNTGTGQETVLNTFCSGSSPTVTFTDGYGNIDGDYRMTDGNGHYLYYQLSNASACTGVVGDGNMGEDDTQSLAGVPAFDICAAVETFNGNNLTAPAGSYSDTVSYIITP